MILGPGISALRRKRLYKCRHLSPEEKFQIFIEATVAKAKSNGSIAEVLRRWGIHSSDLLRIRNTIEQGAIEAFEERKSRKPKVNYNEYRALKMEKEGLETTVLQQSAELALIKKKELLG